MFDSKSVDLSTLTETLQSLADIVSRQSRRRGALPMIPAVQPVTEDGVIERLAEIQRVVSLMADNLRNDARENLPTTINLTSNGLQEAFRAIEHELSRLRPEQFRGSGTVSVQHTPNGINIHGRSGDTAFTPQLSRRTGVTFAVDLEQVGGTQGDDTTAASWTYDVYDAASWELLASAVDPTALRHGWQRPSVGQMIAATNGTAHWDIDDELVLDWINEMVDAEACE